MSLPAGRSSPEAAAPKRVRKSTEQMRAETLAAAHTAERDAREFNTLLVRSDPRITKEERTIVMGLVWHFFAEYRRKMTLLKGPAAAQDIGKLHAELVREQQQLQNLGPDGAELLRQFNLRRAVPFDECKPHGAM
jgi:hypothetical protein